MCHSSLLTPPDTVSLWWSVSKDRKVLLSTVHLMRFCLISGTMHDGGPALVKKGCFRSSLAVARWLGSLTRSRSRKPFIRGDTFCTFFSLGGKLSLIIFIAFSGGSLKYGGSPSTISITMIPRDQISTSGP